MLGEQQLLATLTAAQWEEQLILIKSPPSFCKEVGVWVWMAG